MKQVLCFGEALIDFLQIDAQQEGPLSLKDYRQYPGGAPANAAVAVARLGGRAFFAGQVGKDVFGDFIVAALTDYGVDTRFLCQHPVANTALAFVTLDKKGDRSFTFYRDKSADLLFSQEQLSPDWFTLPGYKSKSIFHVCSNTLTTEAIAEVTFSAVHMAKSQGALVSIDVNLRHNLWPEGVADSKRVQRLVEQGDIIKFAREELEYLVNDASTLDTRVHGGNTLDVSALDISNNESASSTQEYIDACLEQGVKLIVVTNGELPIDIFSATGTACIDVPKVTVVDTTAAGDAFSGALLFTLSQVKDINRALACTDFIKNMVSFASHCSAHAVSRQGAFPSLASFNDVKGQWQTLLADQFDFCSGCE